MEGKMALFEPWHLWVLLGIALMVGEMFTLGFFLACFGVAALMVALVSLLGTGLVFQVFIFSLISLVCIFTVRPFLLRFSSAKAREIRTGVRALAGETALVEEAFGGPGSHGKIRIRGEIWRAMGKNGEVFSKGDLVVVESVSGVTLVVRPVHEQNKEKR
jgi:membrane protein implicated in regulation of membrane protease activity